MRSKDKQVNTQLPSLSDENVVQIMVAGETAKVERFWQFLVTSAQYRLTDSSRRWIDVSDQQQKMHVVMQLEEIFNQQREEYTVQLETTNGQKINLLLSDAHVIEISDGKTYIHGKSYDIFSNPNRNGNRKREESELTLEE